MSCHENVNIYKPMLMTIGKVIPETPDVRTFQLAFADEVDRGSRREEIRGVAEELLEHQGGMISDARIPGPDEDDGSLGSADAGGDELDDRRRIAMPPRHPEMADVPRPDADGGEGHPSLDPEKFVILRRLRMVGGAIALDHEAEDAMEGGDSARLFGK